MTDDEYDRLDDDGAGDVLDCEAYGAASWDYGPIGPDDLPGRRAEDALWDAIDDLNESRAREGVGEFPPDTGWLELARDERSATFVHDAIAWRFLIDVGGDPDHGVWRHNQAFVCHPDQ